MLHTNKLKKTLCENNNRRLNSNLFGNKIKVYVHSAFAQSKCRVLITPRRAEEKPRQRTSK